VKRRQFIAGLGSAAAWPVVARAQQGNRIRRIGVLMGFNENDPEGTRRYSAFPRALADLGWTDGRNVRIGRSRGRCLWWGSFTVGRPKTRFRLLRHSGLSLLNTAWLYRRGADLLRSSASSLLLTPGTSGPAVARSARGKVRTSMTAFR
jgi:hypothetical protein